MGRDIATHQTDRHRLSRRILTRLVMLVLALGLITGVGTPAIAMTADGDTLLAFTSDVHNKSNNQSRDRLIAWIDTVYDSYGGTIDYMGFCGDMGDASSGRITEAQFWQYTQAAIAAMDDKIAEGKVALACYTTGNHEFSPGKFNTTTSATKARYTVDAVAPGVPATASYYLYCMGSRNNAQSSTGYTSDQISKLTSFLQGCGTDKPIFVITHFPLHYYSVDNRLTQNAGQVIEVLNSAANQGKTIVFLWGHNHSQEDPQYDEVVLPNSSLQYSRNASATIKFAYCAAGCMSDSEYVGSESVKGKGIVIVVDKDTHVMTLTYHDANGDDVTEGGQVTFTPPAPPATYTITWKNEDGTTLRTSQVTEGSVPTYSGETPTKDPDAQYSYTFAGWTPALVAATGNATYTATYTQTPRTYTITWKNDNGRTLATSTVQVGQMPSYSGPAPTKGPTAQYTYTFSGWTPELMAVTGDAIYTATYSQQTRTYTVTWKDGDGNTLKAEQVAYGATPSYTGATPTKAATAQYGYTFSGSWSPAITAVTGDATYTAQFDRQVRSYTVTWKDGNGDTLKADTLEYGTTPVYSGATPTKAQTAQYSYAFSGSWSPAITAVTGDATYTAQFSQVLRRYTVRFVDYDGAEISSREYDYGTVANRITRPADPTRPPSGQSTYTFSGWSPTITAVTGDATYTATYNATPFPPDDPPIDPPVDPVTPVWKRLEGSNRYGTMAAIVREGFETCNVAVLATGKKYPDALVAAVLAGAKHCPVILTKPTALPEQAKDRLTSLGVTKVYVVGGTSAISEDVLRTLNEMNIVCERVSGSSRQGTSSEVMKAVAAGHGFSGTVVVATGYNFADALSISPWCYKTMTPILLTNKAGKLTDAQVEAARELGVNRVIVVGGTSAVSDEVAKQLNVTGDAFIRLRGGNRYETSHAIAVWEIDQGMTLAHVAVTTGQNFPDALAGAALCGVKNSVLLLARDETSATLDVVATYAETIQTGYVLGGEAAVSAELFTLLESLTA